MSFVRTWNGVDNLPAKLHWAGWEANTYRLHQAGWEISAKQDVYNNGLQLAINHPQLDMRGISERVSHQYMAEYTPQSRRPVDLSLAMLHMGRSIQIVEETPFSARDYSWAAIEASPTYAEGRPLRSLQDYARFQPAAPRTAPMVVPEASVDELLSRILEMQEKAKTDYFRDMIAREGQVLPAHKFHGQIISLRAAA